MIAKSNKGAWITRFFSVFVLCSLAAGCSRGKNLPPEPPVVEAHLEFPNSRIVMGEPLVFTLTLKTHKPTPIDLGPNRLGNIVFTIASGDGEKTFKLKQPEDTRSGILQLHYNDSFVERFFIPHAFLPQTQGIYSLKANLADQPVGFVSDAPRFTLVKKDEKELKLFCIEHQKEIEKSRSSADTIELASELRDIEDPVVIESIQTLLGEGHGFDTLVVQALVRFDSVDAAHALAIALRSTDPYVVFTAENRLRELSKSADPAVRSEARKAISNHGVSGRVPDTLPKIPVKPSTAPQLHKTRVNTVEFAKKYLA